MTTSRVSSLRRNIPLFAASALFVVSMSGEAFAENPATSVGSKATGLVVDLQLASTVSAGISTGTVGGEAPPTYTPTTATVASVNQNLSLGSATGGLLKQGVSTGVITATASGAFPTSSSTATVNNLGLDLKLSILTLLGINATTLTSTTQFNGTSLIGSSNIVGLTLSTLLPGVSLGAAVNGTPSANYHITDSVVEALGLSIIENEQVLSTTVDTAANTHTTTLTTDALHISYKDFLVGGKALTGDIVIAQSAASFTRAIPEASTWAMMIIGLGGLGASLRLRNRARIGVRFGAPQAA